METASDGEKVFARFGKYSYTVSYSAGANGTIEGKQTQTVAWDESGTEVKATPAEGFYFDKWSDGETSDVRRAERVKTDLSVTAEFKHTVFREGSGTADDPYLVRTYEQLCSLGMVPNACFTLMQDLDLKGIVHKAICPFGKPFCGVFDGNGREISNMTADTKEKEAALFGALDGAVVRNLRITNALIDFSQDKEASFFGLLAGRAKNTTLDAITVQGVFLGGWNNLGGLCGIFEVESKHKVSVSNCAVNISLRDSSNNAGGMFGYLCADGTATLTNCAVKAQVENASVFGGIAARTAEDGKIFVDRCWTSGTVEARYFACGLFVWACNCTVTGCDVSMDLTSGKSAEFIKSAGSCQISESKFLGSITSLNEQNKEEN